MAICFDMETKYHLQEDGQEIPDGYQIFEERLEVAGITFRKNAATSFCEAKRDQRLELEADFGNEHDKNAIKVIGCAKGIFGTKRWFIGFVPRQVAKAIIEGGYWSQVKPRLLMTRTGYDGYVEVLFQILGPKGKRYDFQRLSAPDAHSYGGRLARIKQTYAAGEFDEAIKLLYEWIEETEAECRKEKFPVVPWCYERLAMIYRKQGLPDKEVEILERHAAQPHASSVQVEALSARLAKARHLSLRKKK